MNADYREYCAKEVASCGLAYEQGNLGAVRDAVYWCNEGKFPLPDWLFSAVMELLLPALGFPKQKRSGRGDNWILQYKRDMLDLERWDTVREAKDSGIPPADAYEAAAMILATGEKPLTANGVETVCKRVNKNSRTAPLRYKILRTIKADRQQTHAPDWEKIRQMQKDKKFRFP